MEPSGIYTLEDFYDIIESPAVAEVCSVGSILMIADPLQLRELDEESEKVVYSQVAGAGQVIVSKMDMQQVSKKETIERLQNILRSHGNEDRTIEEYITFRNWSDFTENDFRRFRECGYFRNRRNLSKQDHSMLFQNTTISPVFETYEEMEYFLRRTLNGECGEIIRIKGHLQLTDGKCYEINCTQRDLSVKVVEFISEKGINLIGRKINRKSLRQNSTNLVLNSTDFKKKIKK